MVLGIEIGPLPGDADRMIVALYWNNAKIANFKVTLTIQSNRRVFLRISAIPVVDMFFSSAEAARVFETKCHSKKRNDKTFCRAKYDNI